MERVEPRSAWWTVLFLVKGEWEFKDTCKATGYRIPWAPLGKHQVFYQLLFVQPLCCFAQRFGCCDGDAENMSNWNKSGRHHHEAVRLWGMADLVWIPRPHFLTSPWRSHDTSPQCPHRKIAMTAVLCSWSFCENYVRSCLENMWPVPDTFRAP